MSLNVYYLTFHLSYTLIIIIILFFIFISGATISLFSLSSQLCDISYYFTNVLAFVTYTHCCLTSSAAA